MILSLTLFGQMLERKARSKTSAAIKSLLGLAPKTARRVNPDGTEQDVALAEDESMLTGEPMPVTKAIGDTLIGATLNTAAPW